MEIISDKKLGKEPRGEEGQIPPELKRVMAIKIAEEAATLGGDTEEKEDKKPGWRSKATKVLIGLTVIALAMAVAPKSAKAGGRFLPTLLQEGARQGVTEGFQSAREQRQREQNREDELFRARLDVGRQAIQQQRDDRNQIRQLNVRQVEQEIQQINNRINTYEQAKAGAIQKLSEPKADTATIERQIRLCEGEIAKLEQKRASYIGAATGITPTQAPSQAPRGEYRPNPAPSPASQGDWRPMPPQTPPPPPQMRPNPGYPAPSPASQGDWRPMPPQTPPPPQMRPRSNGPVSPPSYSDEKPLPPLPDL
jgi:hypothetical protein